MSTRPNYGENATNPTREVLKMHAYIAPGHPYFESALKKLRVSEIVTGDYITLTLYRTVTGSCLIRQARCGLTFTGINTHEVTLNRLDDEMGEFKHRSAILFLSTRDVHARRIHIIPEAPK